VRKLLCSNSNGIREGYGIGQVLGGTPINLPGILECTTETAVAPLSLIGRIHLRARTLSYP
jgi:hypothetical protein